MAEFDPNELITIFNDKVNIQVCFGMDIGDQWADYEDVEYTEMLYIHEAIKDIWEGTGTCPTEGIIFTINSPEGWLFYSIEKVLLMAFSGGNILVVFSITDKDKSELIENGILEQLGFEDDDDDDEDEEDESDKWWRS